MASVYEILTQKFIDQMEKGTVPWQKPWDGISERAFSYSTRAPYNKLNQLILDKGGWYYTRDQIAKLGFVVPKIKPYQVYTSFKAKQKKNESDEEFEKRKKKYPYSFSYYNVWHESDINGLPQKDPLPDNDFESIDSAEDLMSKYIGRENIKLEYVKGDSAYYIPSFDSIVLPFKEQFRNENRFYSTAFHEISHSTGHESRLNRVNRKSKFGDDDYSKEELVAEISAACILQMLGIDTSNTFDNSAAYINSWISKLKSNTKLIYFAALDAEKAVNYILKGKEN